MRAIFLSLLLAGAPVPAGSDTSVSPAEISPYDQGAAGLETAIRRLATRASLLTIVAHPDDEDGILVTREARGRGSRVAMLTLTRGEGGKNAMGPDLGDALGLIRTQETLRADGVYGVEQLWGSAVDYGFSKSAEEALRNWGSDRALADAVRAIRRVRPLVVTSTFVGGPSDGHGHHQVAGIAAQRAFLLAGDPNAFPEQITQEGLRPWRPLKVYGHVPVATITDKGMVNYATGAIVPVRFTNHVDGTETAGLLSTDVEIDTGTYSTLTGRTFAQIAREGMRAHRTQFPDLGPMLPGIVPARYHRFGTNVEVVTPERDLFDGIDVSLTGLADIVRPGHRAGIAAGLRRLQNLVERIEARFDARRPEGIAPSLARGLTLVRREIASASAAPRDATERDDLLFELSRKARQFEDALTLALQITATAVHAPSRVREEPLAGMGWGNPMGDQSPLLVRGQGFRFNVELSSASPVTLLSATPEGREASDWRIESPAGPTPVLAPGSRLTLSYRATVPEAARRTELPYRREGAVLRYDAEGAGQSLGPVPLTVRVRFRYGDVAFEQRVPLLGMQPSSNRGPFPVQVAIVPALSVALDGDRQILPTAGGDFVSVVELRNDGPTRRTGELALGLPAGWTASPAVQAFDLRPGEAGQLRFTLSTGGPVQPGRHIVTATARSEGQDFSSGFALTGYDGLPPYPFYRPATAMLSAVDVAVPRGLSVAYVAGTGDGVPAVLRALHIAVDVVAPDRIGRGDLARHDAVLIGVGAYGHVSELARAIPALRHYVQAGGVVVVQGPSGGPWPDLFPAPITRGDKGTQVTEEDGPVTFLAPGDRLLRYPNPIGQADFAGWIDQRGDDFPHDWGADYHALLSMHDTEQDAQEGALLDLSYGKGHFLYTALAFHRQLPAGVPGATRLLVNLLSRGRR